MTFETDARNPKSPHERPDHRRGHRGHEKMSTTKTKGTALVTGASSGIGAIYADRLAKRGYDLIRAARNQPRLAALAKRLKDETGRSVETIAADLNDKTDLARIETTLRTNTSITLLVNNAGVGAAAPLLNSDIEKMDEMIRLNVGALTRLTYAAVPGFVGQPGERADIEADHFIHLLDVGVEQRRCGAHAGVVDQ